MFYAVGRAAITTMVSPKVAALVEGVLNAMLLRKLTMVAGLLVLIVATSLGSGAFLQQPSDSKEKRPATAEVTQPATNVQQPIPLKVLLRVGGHLKADHVKAITSEMVALPDVTLTVENAGPTMELAAVIQLERETSNRTLLNRALLKTVGGLLSTGVRNIRITNDAGRQSVQTSKNADVTNAVDLVRSVRELAARAGGMRRLKELVDVLAE
jgi:hypothetical protein